MKKEQINMTVGIIFGGIILVVLYIVLFSAQTIDFMNQEMMNNMPVNAYTSEQSCVTATELACEMVITDDNQELWIVAE